MSTLVPITSNIYSKEVSDLPLSWTSNTTLTVGTGYCVDSSKTTVMKLSTSLVLNAAVVGVNGIDTGALTTSSEYYVFVIAQSTAGNDLDSTKAGKLLLSLSATAPVMPAGYDLFRRIGIVKTDGSSHFLLFYQTGKQEERTYLWDEPVSILSGGTSATLAYLDLSAACMLADKQRVKIQALFTPNAANDVAHIVPGTSSATTGQVISGSVAAKVNSQIFDTVAMIVSSVPKIGYKVTASGALTAYVVSFVDIL